MKERIKEVIKRTFDLAEVDNNISTSNCEKWDSLQHLNLVVELESEFNLSIEPEDIAEMKSFNDICRVLYKQLNP